MYISHNGMHGFMEKYPGKHFKEHCFTFDNRITMDLVEKRDIVGICSYVTQKQKPIETRSQIKCVTRKAYCV